MRSMKMYIQQKNAVSVGKNNKCQYIENRRWNN